MHINLDNWYKPEIDKKKLKELSKRNDLPGLVHFFFYFLFIGVSGYLAYITWGTWWSVLFFLYMGQFMLSAYPIGTKQFIELHLKHDGLMKLSIT